MFPVCISTKLQKYPLFLILIKPRLRFFSSPLHGPVFASLRIFFFNKSSSSAPQLQLISSGCYKITGFMFHLLLAYSAFGSWPLNSNLCVIVDDLGI